MGVILDRSAAWIGRAAFALAWVLGLAAIPAGTATSTEAANPAAPASIEAFVRERCPHCTKAAAFLARLGREQPDTRIVIRDVQKEPVAMQRLQQIVREQGGGLARVPAIVAGGQLFIGYSEEARTDRLIRSALAGQRADSAAAASSDSACEAEESLSCPGGPAATTEAPPTFELDFFGRTLKLDDIGLPAFTLAMGVLDGFNPCSMWVLLLMISILAPLDDRRRMVAIAGTFVLVEGIAYFLFMAAWLNLFLFIGVSRASELVIAAIAIIAGLINMKDFFAFGGGISLSIPEKAKPGIYSRIRGLLHAPTMTAAIISAAVLAILVQVVEFLCTSGFPALFTRILTLRELNAMNYYGYLLLYDAAYMLDDVIVLTIGVVMLSRHRLQQREGRWLKLISGIVMIALGIYLALRG
jgi:glutaredoxin